MSEVVRIVASSVVSSGPVIKRNSRAQFSREKGLLEKAITWGLLGIWTWNVLTGSDLVPGGPAGIGDSDVSSIDARLERADRARQH